MRTLIRQHQNPTLAAGPALTTLNYYAGYEFSEVLVERVFQGNE